MAIWTDLLAEVSKIETAALTAAEQIGLQTLKDLLLYFGGTAPKMRVCPDKPCCADHIDQALCLAVQELVALTKARACCDMVPCPEPANGPTP